MKKNKWLVSLLLCICMVSAMMPCASATLNVVKPVKSVTGVLNSAFNLYNDIKDELTVIGAVLLIFAFPIFFYRYEIRRKYVESKNAIIACAIYLLAYDAVLAVVCYFANFDFKLLGLPVVCSVINYIVLTDGKKKIHSFGTHHAEKDSKLSIVVKAAIWTLTVCLFIGLVVWLVAAHVMVADIAVELAYLLLVMLVGARCLCSAWDDHIKNK